MPQPIMRTALVALASTCLLSCHAQTDQPSPSPPSQAGPGAGSVAGTNRAADAPRWAGGPKWALLVGCTEYPNLARSNWLRGPANDVLLFQDLLVKNYDFTADQIRVLSEAQGDGSLRPTKANIVRDFQRLIEATKAGDEVVILLSGHGSRQPDDDPNNAEDREGDGLDEVFCPADVMDVSGRRGKRITNGIVDDDLRKWLGKICDNGASVWIVMDACHSGTGVRAIDTEVRRQQLDLVDEETIQAAIDRAAEASRGAAGQPPAMGALGAPPAGKGWVATYAARPDEFTVEKMLPEGATDAKPYGLFSYAIHKLLSQGPEPLSYAELVEQVRLQYLAWNRIGPTPLVEGPDRDKEVLGLKTRPKPSAIRLRRSGRELRVSAGRLHGLGPGTVFAVAPPSGADDDAPPLGHVKVTESRFAESVVIPCEFAEHPASDDLPEGGVCTPVFVDFGDLRLRVALDVVPPGVGQPLVDQAAQALRKAVAAEGSLVQLAADRSQAQWLVRLGSNQLVGIPDAVGDAHSAVLVPAGGITAGGRHAAEHCVGPVPVDASFDRWLGKSLQCIARAQNLFHLAHESTEQVRRGSDGFDVGIEPCYVNALDDMEGRPIPSRPDGLRLRDDERVAFRIRNNTRFKIHVTLLFIDSAFGVHAVFPDTHRTLDNELQPGQSLLAGHGDVNATTTTGREAMLLIAVKATRVPQDFSFLAREGVEQARGALAGPISPLQELLLNAGFADGAQRGMDFASVESPWCMRLVPWYTEPLEAESSP